MPMHRSLVVLDLLRCVVQDDLGADDYESLLSSRERNIRAVEIEDKLDVGADGSRVARGGCSQHRVWSPEKTSRELIERGTVSSG
jgi:hypothetical protein